MKYTFTIVIESEETDVECVDLSMRDLIRDNLQESDTLLEVRTEVEYTAKDYDAECRHEEAMEAYMDYCDDFNPE